MKNGMLIDSLTKYVDNTLIARLKKDEQILD